MTNACRIQLLFNQPILERSNRFDAKLLQNDLCFFCFQGKHNEIVLDKNQNSNTLCSRNELKSEYTHKSLEWARGGSINAIRQRIKGFLQKKINNFIDSNCIIIGRQIIAPIEYKNLYTAPFILKHLILTQGRIQLVQVL